MIFFFKFKIAEIKYLSLKTNSLFLLLGFTLSSSLLEMRLLTRSMTQGTTSNAYITKRAPRHAFLRKLHTVTGFSRRTAFFFISITSVHYAHSKLSQIKNCMISHQIMLKATQNCMFLAVAEQQNIKDEIPLHVSAAPFYLTNSRK